MTSYLATAIPVVLLGCGIFLLGFLIGAKLGHRAAVAEAEAKRKNDDLAARLREQNSQDCVYISPMELRCDPLSRMIIWPRGPWWV